MEIIETDSDNKIPSHNKVHPLIEKNVARIRNGHIVSSIDTRKHSDHFEFSSLDGLVDWIKGMSIFPGILCILGLVQTIILYPKLSYAANSPELDHLYAPLLHEIHNADLVRVAQISCTGIFVTFMLIWLYRLYHNIDAIYRNRFATKSVKIALIYQTFMAILTALSSLKKVQKIIHPKGPDYQYRDLTLMYWWLSLVTANIAKIVAVTLFIKATTVFDYQNALLWMAAGYILYLSFYYWSLTLVNSITSNLNELASFVLESK